MSSKAYLIGMYKNDKLVSLEIFSEPAESLTTRISSNISYKTIDIEDGNSFQEASTNLKKRVERLIKNK